MKWIAELLLDRPEFRCFTCVKLHDGSHYLRLLRCKHIKRRAYLV